MISISQHSGIYTLLAELSLPISLKNAWEFFSSPKNLQKITPPEMGFKITSGKIERMHPGQIVTYTVGVLPMVRTNWVTEITHVEDWKYFVDEQRFGPYKMWHHEHHFEQKEDGVLMTDKVSYKVPFGIFGRVAHALFIESQLKRIFSYRSETLSKHFQI